MHSIHMGQQVQQCRDRSGLGFEGGCFVAPVRGRAEVPGSGCEHEEGGDQEYGVEASARLSGIGSCRADQRCRGHDTMLPGGVQSSAGEAWELRVSVMRTRKPCGTFGLARTVPLWTSAILVTMARPSPAPGRTVVVVAR